MTSVSLAWRWGRHSGLAQKGQHIKRMEPNLGLILPRKFGSKFGSIRAYSCLHLPTVTVWKSLKQKSYVFRRSISRL